MSSFKTPLNLDSNFQNWTNPTTINATNWTFANTNATQVQLDRRHARDHPERARFPSAQKSSDYIYNGRFSWRGSIDVALGTFTLTSNEFAVEPGKMNPAMLLVCRQSAGLTVQARVVLADDLGGTDNGTLSMGVGVISNNTVPRNFFWDTATATDLDLGADGNAINFWRGIGIQMPIVPAGALAMQVRVEVTDVSGDIPGFFDIGELSVVGQGSVIHGVG